MSDNLLNAMGRRLGVVSPYLVGSGAPSWDGSPADTSRLFARVVGAVHERPHDDRVWLLHIALTSVFPTQDWVHTARREAELGTVSAWSTWLLEQAAEQPNSALQRDILLRDGVVLVDVDHSARHDTHTGIQQVIRNTMPVWHAEHSIELVAWHEHGRGLRALSPDEADRVLRWPGQDTSVATRSSAPDVAGEGAPVVVPWNSVLVEPDAPRSTNAAEIAALGACTRTRVAIIGYDCIPVVSPQLVPAGSAEVFARWLVMVKAAYRVAGISATAAAEFQGFVDMLASQGLEGPTVVTCPLPTERGRVYDHGYPPTPVVLAVGSFEPRKNQLGLLHAAEVLWRQGLEFEVVLIGGNTFGRDVSDRVDELAGLGRRVSQRHKIAQTALQDAYRTAHVLVFPSMHEGFGLPIAEALAAGTPVITAAVGSMAEIAEAGGCLTVNPRDDDALTMALLRVLTDQALLARLRAEIPARPDRSWSTYARQLWDALVDASAPERGRAA